MASSCNSLTLKELADHCRRLYSFDTDIAHGCVHVSKGLDPASLDLFDSYLSGMLCIDIIPDVDYGARYEIKPLSGVLPLSLFDVFRAECRLPIYVRL